MKVPQHLIDEATRRGIVPGAVVSVVHTDGITATVMPFDEWEMYGENLNAGREGYSRWNVMQRGEWSIVITPAPSQGLEEGMATECSPAMRAAIVELANEIGLVVPTCTSRRDPEYPILLWHGDKLDTCHKTYQPRQDLAPEDFIAKMRATAQKPKPLKIGEWNVKFEKGSIEVGCQRITNETVRAIAAKLKD